jgi:hypothetical protein
MARIKRRWRRIPASFVGAGLAPPGTVTPGTLARLNEHRPSLSSVFVSNGFVDIVVRTKKNRIEVSYEILRAAPKRPISAQVCGEWARKSGYAALRMTRVRSVREEVNRAI